VTAKTCLVASASALLAVAACSNLSGDDVFPPGPDAGPPEPLTTLAFAGTYDAEQHWDLSDVFSDEEGAGGLVADMMVSAIVDLAGVPSALEDDARDVVANAVRAPIRDFVNGVVPADLVPDSPLLAQLAATFSDVEVLSAYGLAPTSDPNGFTGSEKVESIRLSYDGTSYDVPLDLLIEGTGARWLSADFEGDVTAQTSLRVAPHTIAWRTGLVVTLAGEALLGRDDLQTLTTQALDAIACADLVAEITGGADSFGVEVRGQSFSVSATDLTAGCDAIEAELGDYVIGFVDWESPVTVGGGLTMVDVDHDERVDALGGVPSYAGEVELAAGFLVRQFSIELDAPHQ